MGSSRFRKSHLKPQRNTIGQLVAWQSELGEDAPRSVSVNVSALQLRSGDFAEEVASVLAETGLVAEPTPEALGAALAAVMGDPARAARLGGAGRQVLAERELTWPRTVERLLA